MTDFTSMSGPELVRAYNTMAGSTTGQELQAKTVSRFATPEVGRKRCEKLASSIRARETGLASAGPEVVVTAAELAAMPPVAVEAFATGDGVAVAFDSEERVMTRKARTKKTKAPKPNGIHGEFGVNPAKFNGKLLQTLWENKNKQLDWKLLIKPVYGSKASNEKQRGALKMVWRGLEKARAKSKEAKAKYDLLVERSEEGTTYELRAKA